jgi:hypothetical protein
MESTPNPTQTNPREVLVARADEELARAYEQIVRADEELARVDKQLSKLAHDGAPHPAAAGNQPLLGGRAVRGVTGLLLAACIGVAAIAWQSSYGDAARQIIARWAPQLVLTSSLPLEKPELPAQPSVPTLQAAIVQAAAAETAPPQPVSPAQSAPEDVAPGTALSPELAQLLGRMARDLAIVGQGIEQLKASQAQIARDNVKIAEQLRATQEQMARVVAKPSEQNLRRQISAPPPRPTAIPARKPVPPPQASAQPQAESGPEATAEPQAEPRLSSVPRPPMPLR